MEVLFESNEQWHKGVVKSYKGIVDVVELDGTLYDLNSFKHYTIDDVFSDWMLIYWSREDGCETIRVLKDGIEFHFIASINYDLYTGVDDISQEKTIEINRFDVSNLKYIPYDNREGVDITATDAIKRHIYNAAFEKEQN